MGLIRTQWFVRMAPHLVFALLSAVFVGTVVSNHGQDFSVFDEYVYYDYLVKFPEHGIVRQGEEIGPETRAILSCHGSEPFGLIGQPCGSDYADDSAYPLEGKTSGDLYTPLFFAVTWLGAKLIQLVGDVDLLTAARLTGAAWLAATLSALHVTCRRFGADPTVAFAVCLAFFASPFAWWTYTYISTDAPSALFGAVALLLLHRHLHGQRSTAWFIALALIAVMFKITNLFIVGLIVVVVLLADLSSPRGRWQGVVAWLKDRWWVLLVAALPMTAQVLWMVFRTSQAVSTAADQGISTDGIQWEHLLQQVGDFIPGAITSNVVLGSPPTAVYDVPSYLVEPLSWMTVVGALGAAAVVGLRYAPLHSATALAGLTFAPILAVAMTIVVGSTFDFPARYGAPLLPAFLLGYAVLCRRTAVQWATLAYTVLLSAYVLATMVELA